METKPRLLRITTVAVSLKLLLDGQFTYFQQQGFDVLTVSADGPEVEYLKSKGVAHTIVPMSRKITPLQDLICLFRLIGILRKYQPHIIHTHTPKAGLLGMLAGWICSVPVRFHTVAGLPLMEAVGLKRWALKMTERITYACAHRVYPNSKGLLEYIGHEFNLTSTDFKVIGKGSSNGIDITWYTRNPELERQASEIRKQHGISEEVIVFSFVGRLVKDKGIRELVQAFQQVSEGLPASLLLIGPFEQELDPLPDDVLNIIRNDKRVIVAGFQHDVRPWMMAADIFVFPSYREGFPNVVLQAACLEIPCIVSDINGCNEIIQREVTGLLVPVKDAEALSNAMRSLAGNKASRISFGKKSRQFVEENFDRQNVWNMLLQEYQVALRERKK